ncbi:M48 family metalloprotease [Sediminitomix flava]|uniref:Peptidase M48-like protein n=1 Tax=Sediminitomix flava TaxID=379075 RepID=A0A315Z5S5_SEDFL|nr:M48 family metalloprotease [Sediminitomix flava]PWJ38627.1 peptidase M48-like protein [Sediminitomix flava]
MLKHFSKILSFILIMSFTASCGEDGVFLFSIEDDVALGAQVNDQILSDPQTYPVLSEDDYPDAYNYLRGILDDILASPEIKYKDTFAYDQIKIIDNDVLNAFATPGGYIYVHKGLIQYLDHEDHLAGVIGHEIAHAEKRHSSKAMQRQYGISILLEILLGNSADYQQQLAQIATSLVTLKFGRDQEAQSDEFSVKYLKSTSYDCGGAAGFFEKMESDPNFESSTPAFLSTHPSNDSRISDIRSQADAQGCERTEGGITTYQQFKNMLP